MTHRGYHIRRYRGSLWRYCLIMLGGGLACCSRPAGVAPGSTAEVFPQLGHSNTVNAITFSSDGRLLASVGKDGAAKLWDVSAQREIRTLKRKDELDSVAFSPDDKILATGGRDGAVVLWEVSTGREVRVLPGPARRINAVAFSPDGRTIASGSDDHTIKLWDPQAAPTCIRSPRITGVSWRSPFHPTVVRWPPPASTRRSNSGRPARVGSCARSADTRTA